MLERILPAEVHFDCRLKVRDLRRSEVDKQIVVPCRQAWVRRMPGEVARSRSARRPGIPCRLHPNMGLELAQGCATMERRGEGFCTGSSRPELV